MWNVEYIEMWAMSEYIINLFYSLLEDISFQWVLYIVSGANGWKVSITATPFKSKKLECILYSVYCTLTADQK